MNSYARPRNFLVARPTLRMWQIRLGDVWPLPQNFRWRSWQRLLISTSRHHRHNWGQFLSNCKTLRRFAPKCNDFLAPTFGVRVHLVLCFGARLWHKPSVRESVILGALSKPFWRVFVDFRRDVEIFPARAYGARARHHVSSIRRHAQNHAREKLSRELFRWNH